MVWGLIISSSPGNLIPLLIIDVNWTFAKFSLLKVLSRMLIAHLWRIYTYAGWLRDCSFATIMTLANLFLQMESEGRQTCTRFRPSWSCSFMLSVYWFFEVATGILCIMFTNDYEIWHYSFLLPVVCERYSFRAGKIFWKKGTLEIDDQQL